VAVGDCGGVSNNFFYTRHLFGVVCVVRCYKLVVSVSSLVLIKMYIFVCSSFPLRINKKVKMKKRATKIRKKNDIHVQ